MTALVRDKDYNIVLISDYEDIVEAFNILIKTTGAEFVAGELDSYDCSGYDNAYYLEFDNEEIWLGKAVWDDEKYYCFESDIAFVKDDFYKDYLTNNDDEGVIVFGYDEGESEKDLDDHVKFCMDDDECGFCCCIDDDNNHMKFKYKGNKKLNKEEISKIIDDYVF